MNNECPYLAICGKSSQSYRRPNGAECEGHKLHCRGCGIFDRRIAQIGRADAIGHIIALFASLRISVVIPFTSSAHNWKKGRKLVTSRKAKKVWRNIF